MNQTKLTNSNNWNSYWGREQTERFTKISWSKKRIMHVLSRYTKAGGHALDAGCGSGFFSNYFCEQGMTTVSLDYSQEALEIAERSCQGRSNLFKCNLLEENLFGVFGEKFDLIFTDGLFEHFSPSDQDKIIKNLTSCLSSKGYLVTFVPNKWSPWELIRPFYMPGIKEDPFVLNQLVELNTRADLKVEAKGGLNTVPFAFSPDSMLGSVWGMLLYTIAKKHV